MTERTFNYHHLLYFWAVVREGGISKAAEAAPVTADDQRPNQDARGGTRRAPVSAAGTYARPDRCRSGRRAICHGNFHGGQRTARDAQETAVRSCAQACSRSGECGAQARSLPAAEARGRQRRAGADHALRTIPSSCSHDWRHTRWMSSSAIPRRRLTYASRCSTIFWANRALRSLPASCSHGACERVSRARSTARRCSFPTLNTSVRRALEQWFEAEDVRPVVAGEFEDPALLNTFGERGDAVFAAPTAIEAEILGGRGSESLDELRSCGNGTMRFPPNAVSRIPPWRQSPALPGRRIFKTRI